MFIDFPASEILIKGAENIRVPELAHMRQIYPSACIPDPEARLRTELERVVPGQDRFRGKRIAVTVGSRGIPGLPGLLRTLCGQLKEWGASPFLVPAMGSHGGGTAQEQTAYLNALGITEEAVGAPILSSMEVVRYGALPDGTPCYCDRYAYESDGIVVLNKIKPHTEFRGAYESGLAKMIAIGLGKHVGAAAFHVRGYDSFAERLPQAAELFLWTGRCAFAVAVVQNAYDRISELEVIRPEDILAREPVLLERAKQQLATLKGREIDVLIIDEIGKNISGGGHDSNVTGRNCSGLPGFGKEVLDLKRLFIRGLAPGSKHNGNGIGLADITTRRCLREIDWNITWTNLINATMLQGASMPLYANNDWDALRIAIRTLNIADYGRAKIVRIRNTLAMEDIQVSRAYWETVRGRPDVSLTSGFSPLSFDPEGNLI